MSLNFASSALDPRYWSITSRMTLLFAVALSGVLFSVTGLQYRELRYQLHEADEAELQRTMLFQQELVKGLSKKKLPEHFEHEWIEHIDRGDRLFLRVITPQGVVYAESPGMPARSEFALIKNRFRTINFGTGSNALLLTATTVDTSPQEKWKIEGALDVTESGKIISAYGRRLVVLLIASVIFGTGLGWLVARQGLSPIRQIGALMERISAEKLDKRIGARPWPAELQSLAQVFDAMLARLQTSFDQLSRFSADLAHEFRTPVNNLVAAASVTLSRARSETEYQETLTVIVEEGERLTRMISSMLFLARADNAEQAVNKEPLSTGQEFSKLREFFDALAEQRGVHISSHGDVALEADPVLLRRALSNLIANSIQHMPDGGTVNLAATRGPGGVLISVADDGEGIAEEHLPHLFTRFYRVDPSRASSERSGLGLAVVKSIAELHGGTVQIESRQKKGTTATLFFPQ